jgi:menaquinol-cytochrome c reductase iron-sulfur subunit
MDEEQQISRRNFLGATVWTLGGLITLGLGVPAIAYIIGPSLERSATDEWLRLGAAAKVEIGVPTLFKLKIQRKAGWIVSEEELAIYVSTENGRTFTAMSNICTHLGCRIRWVTARKQFFCPCHDGVYDKDGNVVSGPPPRPLDRYEIKAEDGQLSIRGGAA